MMTWVPENNIPGMPGSFLLEGKTFTRDLLLEHCMERCADEYQPRWKKDVLDFITRFLDPSAGDILQKTSGSTGDPKEYQLRREAMVRSAERTTAYFGLRQGTRVLLCLPVEYIAGKMMVVRALVGQLDLVMVEPSGRPLKDFQENAGFCSMVPLQVYESLRAGDPLDSLDILLVGGGELHRSLRERLAGLQRPEVYESFGMTETYTHFALRRINGLEPDNGFRPLPGITIGTGRNGCLEVEVPGVTEGRITTHDLVETDTDGSFRWLGRYDNVISTGGIKIIPELVEEKIRQLIELECLLLPEPDPRLGQRLVLIVETPEGMADAREIQARLREILSGHELPRRIVQVPSIPRNSSHKPDRPAARRLI